MEGHVWIKSMATAALVVWAWREDTAKEVCEWEGEGRGGEREEKGRDERGEKEVQ